MSYMVCHFGKYKAGNVFGLQKHNQRENENYTNNDIDKARMPLNYDLINKDNKLPKENKKHYRGK